MAKKLKTYETSLGFFDLAIAAPSMKAALEAWGADSNLFHQGAARQSEDPDVIAATMAAPGVVLKRPVGSNGPSRSRQNCLPISPATAARRGPAASRRAVRHKDLRGEATTRRRTGRPHSFSRRSTSAARASARRKKLPWRRSASGGSMPSTRHKVPWTQPAGSTKRKQQAFEPSWRLLRRRRGSKRRVGRRR
jgi:hypothetical protein